MNDQEFHKKIHKIIGHISWETIQAYWVNGIKHLEVSAPKEKLDTYIPLTDFIDTNDFNDDSETIENISLLHNNIYYQSTFLMHKALYALTISEQQAYTGSLTWSLTEAYQSSIFTAKSILGLLGITHIQHKNETYLIDLWSENKSNNIAIHKIGRIKLEHRHIWMIFFEVCKKINITIFHKSFTKLAQIDYKNISKQRNHIFYENYGWLYDDLNQVTVDENFGLMDLDSLKKKPKYEKSQISP
ncbi:MAG: hypothetical protein AB7D34_08020 [Sulfurimonas sp.]